VQSLITCGLGEVTNEDFERPNLLRSTMRDDFLYVANICRAVFHFT
jgi:hypothetical protein